MRAVLSGWGRTSPSAAEVFEADSEVGIATFLHEFAHRAAGSPSALIARGLGRSYGDAAQCAGGSVLEMTGMTAVHDADLERGIVSVGAGISIGDLIATFLPHGWFVPVTPGTRHVTVGGAIAADIHGKNHHVDGSFGLHVDSLTLLTPDGPLECNPQAEGRDAYWATVGGMGLTGIIARATLRLLAVETSQMLVDTQRCTDLDDLLSTMAETDGNYRYSVAWFDTLSRGRSLGRSVLTRAHHATRADLPRRRLAGRNGDPLRYHPRDMLAAPDLFPSSLLNQWTVRAFNEVWYRKAPRVPRRSLESVSHYFHPLDGVRNWNRAYGPRGFLQYQVVLPFGAESELRFVIESIAATGSSSFLAVLKRFGAASAGHLSFPVPGWTLALDLPAWDPRLSSLLDRLDESVCAAGGRVYLAKDSRLRPDLVGIMYPRLDEWRCVRAALDPRGLFASDLSRRLKLV